MTAAALPRCVMTRGCFVARTRFRAAAASFRRSVTGMMSEALGIDVPPSVRSNAPFGAVGVRWA